MAAIGVSLHRQDLMQIDPALGERLGASGQVQSPDS
jgi:hypothetical protein